MPINDFLCEQCGFTKEVLHGMNEEVIESCPRCEVPLIRKISVPRFKFMGTGWYHTDYGSGYVTEDKVQSAKAARRAEENKRATEW